MIKDLIPPCHVSITKWELHYSSNNNKNYYKKNNNSELKNKGWRNMHSEGWNVPTIPKIWRKAYQHDSSLKEKILK